MRVQLDELNSVLTAFPEIFISQTQPIWNEVSKVLF